MRLAGTRAVVVGVCVLVWGAACGGGGGALDSRRSDALQTAIQKLRTQYPEYPGKRLRDLTGFSWSAVHTFEEGTKGEVVRAATGSTAISDGGSVQPEHTLLVFVERPGRTRALAVSNRVAPFSFETKRRYSDQVRLIDPSGYGSLDLREPSPIQALLDEGQGRALDGRLAQVRSETALRDLLPFRWDALQVFELRRDARALRERTGLTVTKADLNGAGRKVIVFFEGGRATRIAPTGLLLFTDETRKSWRGVTWKAGTRVAPAPDRRSFVLRAP